MDDVARLLSARKMVALQKGLLCTLKTHHQQIGKQADRLRIDLALVTPVIAKVHKIKALPEHGSGSAYRIHWFAGVCQK
jgi:hypothetical protein